MAAVELAELPGRPCPIAATLELVGERWSLLVVRELLSGARRFGEIVDATGAPRDRLAALATRWPQSSTRCGRGDLIMR
jgi:DNA-binding HxlR family transcriptional regulator